MQSRSARWSIARSATRITHHHTPPHTINPLLVLPLSGGGGTGDTLPTNRWARLGEVVQDCKRLCIPSSAPPHTHNTQHTHTHSYVRGRQAGPAPRQRLDTREPGSQLPLLSWMHGPRNAPAGSTAGLAQAARPVPRAIPPSQKPPSPDRVGKMLGLAVGLAVGLALHCSIVKQPRHNHSHSWHPVPGAVHQRLTRRQSSWGCSKGRWGPPHTGSLQEAHAIRHKGRQRPRGSAHCTVPLHE
jgi:hypothetical protein